MGNKKRLNDKKRQKRIWKVNWESNKDVPNLSNCSRLPTPGSLLPEAVKKKGKVFYGQEPLSGESTTTECGVNYQLLAEIY